MPRRAARGARLPASARGCCPRSPTPCDFPVDLTLNARYLPNEHGLRLVRRRIQDADQILRAEHDGDQGVSDQGYARTQHARDLLAYLQSPEHPRLLRTTISLAVGAREPEELERRVAACRAASARSRCTARSATSSRFSASTSPASRPRPRL